MKPKNKNLEFTQPAESRVLAGIENNIAEEKEAAAEEKEERFRTTLVTNKSLWAEFARINQKMSVTNNSAINMLIARFVRENKQYLEG